MYYITVFGLYNLCSCRLRRHERRKIYPLRFSPPHAAQTIKGAAETQPNPHSQLRLGVIRQQTCTSSRAVMIV